MDSSEEALSEDSSEEALSEGSRSDSELRHSIWNLDIQFVILRAEQ